MTAAARPKSKVTMRGALLAVALGLLSLLSACAFMRGQDAGAREGFTVLFTYKGSAEKVCLRGDFNNWSLSSHCLIRHGPIWRTEVVLAPGRYRYGFFLDDDHWTQDPDALFQEDDGFGRTNSVLIVE